MNANQKRYEVTKLETEIAFGRKPSSQKKPKSKTRLMVGGKTGVTVATYRIGHGHIYIVHTVRYFSKYKNNFKSTRGANLIWLLHCDTMYHASIFIQISDINTNDCSCWI